MKPPSIVRAVNDLLFDAENRSYVDLFSGHGAVLLGHCNPAITKSVSDQLHRAWITGGLPSKAQEAATALVESFFPNSLKLAGFCSTGMEAAEFAIRIARVATCRQDLLGFERNMHGKSCVTAYMGWDNHDGMSLPFVHRMPFLPAADESDVLRRTEEVLRLGNVSAVFVEPIQGSGGGREPSAHFLRSLHDACRASGTLLVFDEILTGFYRTGTPFFFSTMNFVPDMVIFGKAAGNGFPVSGVVVSRGLQINNAMLRGSTYAGNPLACCAVTATLHQMRSLDLSSRVSAIAEAIHGAFLPLQQAGISIRGRGALWVLEMPRVNGVADAVAEIYRRGVCIGSTGKQIRVMPAATIGLDRLKEACIVVRSVLESTFS